MVISLNCNKFIKLIDKILDGVIVPQIGVAAFRQDTPSATKAAIKEYLSKGSQL